MVCEEAGVPDVVFGALTALLADSDSDFCVCELGITCNDNARAYNRWSTITIEIILLRQLAPESVVPASSSGSRFSPSSA